MKNMKKKLKGKARIIKHSFTGNNITKYAGPDPIMKFMDRQGTAICSSVTNSTLPLITGW